MDTLEYINARIKSGTSNDIIKNIDWSKVSSKNPMPFLKNIITDESYFDKNGNFDYTYIEGAKEKRVRIIYRKDINPTIFRHSGSTHDGTLIFCYNNIGKLFETLVNANSYKKEHCPEDYLEEDGWFSYDVNYYVSDFLWYDEYVDHVDKEHGKMFPGTHEEMVMAVEIEYVKRQ